MAAVEYVLYGHSAYVFRAEAEEGKYYHCNAEVTYFITEYCNFPAFALNRVVFRQVFCAYYSCIFHKKLLVRGVIDFLFFLAYIYFVCGLFSVPVVLSFAAPQLSIM